MALDRLVVLLLVLLPNVAASSTHVPTTEVPNFGSYRNVTVEMVIDYIFEKYSTESVLSFEGYEHLLESLSLGVIHIGHSVNIHVSNDSSKFKEFHENHMHPLQNEPIDKHDKTPDREQTIDHQHTSDHGHKNDLYNTKGHTHKDVHDQTSGHDHKNDHDHTDNHTDNHSAQEIDKTTSERIRRNLRDKEVRAVPEELFQKCLRPLDILRLLRFTDQGLSKTQFKELCPLLIAQLDGHSCDHSRHHRRRQGDEHENSEMSSETTVTTETWLYACGAIVVISLSGLICVGVLSLLHHMFVEKFLHFLVAMAVGALTGDAMLHLIPHALSPSDSHAHGTADDHDHDMDGVFKGLAGLAAFYFFFLFGRIQSIASRGNNENKRKIADDVDSINLTMVIGAPDEEGNSALEKVVSVKTKEVDIPKEGNICHTHGHSHGHSHDEPPGSTGAMVWRVIVGDGIHNFTDGLAIGVAFADSITSGLSTSIAVLCHELPHEIGDFAVLLKKGMSVKQALCFNCLSSALSLIGVLAGVAMGNFTSIKVYILVCVAGMFIYISLVDMLPEISNSPSKHPVRYLVFTIMGLVVGSGIMLIIALKEQELKKLTT